MANPSIHRIERINYAIAGIGTLIVMLATRSRDMTLGFLVGAGLTCINFFVLRKLVVKWTAQAASGQPGNAQMLILPKMMGMMGAVAAAVLLLPINVILFAIGYSIFLISIVIETVYSATSGGEPEEQKGNGHG